MTLILDKSSGVDTDLSRSFTNISQTVGVNFHTVENKISLGSIYECLTTLLSWLLFIQFFNHHEVSPSSFVFLHVLIDLLWEFWGWNSNQIWNCGCESPHSREQNFFELNLRMSNNSYVLASFCPILDHEMSPSSFFYDSTSSLTFLWTLGLKFKSNVKLWV